MIRKNKTRNILLLLCVAPVYLWAGDGVSTQAGEVITSPRSSATPSQLLFPFVTDASGLDTEITISNTSQDTVGSTAQAGTCVLNFYVGATPISGTTASIAAGQQLVFDLSQSNAGLNKEGYLIATCSFPLARGNARVFAAGALSFSQDAQAITTPRSTSASQGLLFSYVTNQSGFDTAIAIANTSADPFGSAQVSGSCTLNFFNGGTAPAPVSTGTIAPGTLYTNVASRMAPGFQGYVIASCNFPDAAGLGLITDVAGSSVAISETPELMTVPRDTVAHPLLFPSVSNQGGSDTKIVIANTSADPFGTLGASGQCTLDFYGANAPSPITTPTLGAGEIYTALISTTAPGFQGYIFASCPFYQARGLAYIAPMIGTADADSAMPEVVTAPRSTSTPSHLLFSAVTNQDGEDTNITVSNTSADPLGTAAASGSCTISYFGSMAGGGSVPSPQTSNAIAAGGQLSFSISQGNTAQGIVATPGFRGYVTADCGFPLARGLATVTVLQPSLSISVSHSGNFNQGQSNATYTVTVSNAATAGPADGGVTVTETLPNGLTLVSMAGASGSGWACGGNTCSLIGPLNPGASYPAITVTVNVAANATSPQANEVSVSGDGSATASATDSTIINGPVPVLPTVHIDGPTAGSVLSGSVTVTGWAIDNSSAIGTAIGSVQVKVDGVVVGNATYEVNRPDVCAAYPGRTGCPNVGFSYVVNLAGLTAGSHTITVSATDMDTAPDVGSASVAITVASGPPSVYIDSPASGTVVSGTVTVSGWALDNTSATGTAINAVQVKVDGVVVGTATYGISRSDVCAVYPGRPGCPNVGFTYALNTAALSPGSHLLTVSATDTDSSPDSGSWSITIQVAAPPSVRIDYPAAGATVSGVVNVAGWAIDNVSAVGTAISSVQVKVDGVVVGTATYGINRSDVCAAYPGRPGCPNVGYSYALNTGSLTLGTHTITVTAKDTDGTPDVGSATVTVTVSAMPPSVQIDSPAAGAVVSGTIVVGGWAIDNVSSVGTAISSVKVSVDGVVVGTASYGINRSDVCAAYPGRPGCPNVGYSYGLNTATLTAGAHTITVSATDSDGVPDTGSSSVTVTVAVPAPSVHIDEPAAGSSVSGVVTVGGWAIDNVSTVGTPIGSVQILVDGVLAGTATYGVNRPDVCAAYPGRPGCPNVGFTYQLNTATWSAGTHTVTVTATDTDGTPDTGSASVAVTR